MSSATEETIRITIDDERHVSGLLISPANPEACFVLAHGAGAGMTHPFLAAVATDLALRGIATFRYQFPFMERGGKRPDLPKLAHVAVRAAVAEAAARMPKTRLIAGGRSYGGRMTSQAQALEPLRGVQGLAFLGFPLHPAGRPSQERGDHLDRIDVPMLFLQGTRDALAELPQLTSLCDRLGHRAGLFLVPGADHSFHVPVRSGVTDRQARSTMLDAIASWVSGLSKP